MPNYASHHNSYCPTYLLVCGFKLSSNPINKCSRRPPRLVGNLGSSWLARLPLFNLITQTQHYKVNNCNELFKR